MFRTSGLIALAALALVVQTAGSAWAQSAPYQAGPSLDLDATVEDAQQEVPRRVVPATGAELFTDPPAEDGGWKALANVLDKLTPSVDTRIPLTPSQITDRIESMINQGRYQEALEVIELRKLQREEQNLMGTDVQLLFLEGRALSESGQGARAIDVYRDMTRDFPELPEPWNNLSAEYVRQNRLDMAEQALQTALTINPNYATAQLNLGIVKLMQANDAFRQAAQLGISEASTLSQQTAQILQP
ncbi:MAG TPA: tetratricopeptide repeat protein [Burkholderiaceae bacterium]|nr:tetratricopeptide repeat protein [Burkholderiaceae bacterium]